MIIDQLSNFSKARNLTGSGFRVQGFKRQPQNIEPQNVEGRFRFAQSFIKSDKIHSFDIRFHWTPQPVTRNTQPGLKKPSQHANVP